MATCTKDTLVIETPATRGDGSVSLNQFATWSSFADSLVALTTRFMNHHQNNFLTPSSFPKLLSGTSRSLPGIVIDKKKWFKSLVCMCLEFVLADVTVLNMLGIELTILSAGAMLIFSV